MSREKEHRSFQDKLKQMFKIAKSNPGNIVANRDFTLTDALLRDLGKDSPTATRLKVMRELGDPVLNSKLENNGVERLWSCIQDMFLCEYSNEVRHATFHFLNCLIKGQFESVGMMRAQFFRFIKHHDNPQDFGQRVDLLCTLTNDGKEVEHFEEEIGPFLLSWMEDVQKVGKLYEYLKVIDNVIKFNSPHLDDGIMTDYVRHLCNLCCNSNQYPVLILCLQILGTVVAYSILPPQSLPQFVGTLCRTVNVKCYCPASWKTMKNLLGTHMGHSTLFMMCRLLQEPSLRKDAGIIRGCVFYIHMSLWDVNSMQNLCCPPSSVLPSIYQAVKCNHLSVSYEVSLGIQKLITKYGSKLLEPSWDVILDILSLIIKQINSSPSEVSTELIKDSLRESLNTIETLIENGYFKGSSNKFYSTLNGCVKDRPEQSILKLINYQIVSIRPTEYSWLSNLYNLVQNYFKSDLLSTNVRLKVLSILADVIKAYRQYEEELINRIVIPHTQNIANDDDGVVRAEVGRLLLDLASDYNSKVGLDLLDIIERLLMRPFDKYVDEIQDSADVQDNNLIIQGLIKVFYNKINRLPSSLALKIFKMLLKFLERHYHMPQIFKNFYQHRQLILDCLLKLRADSKLRLGLLDPVTGKFKVSPYIYVSYRNYEVSSPPPIAPVVATLNMDEGFKWILTCVEKEFEWEVLKVVLEGLPGFFANKAIVLAKYGNSEVNNLLRLLCAKLQGKNVPDIFMGKVSRMEFQTTIVAALVSMSSYGTSLDQYHQQSLINTLSKSIGTDPRCSKQTINSLTICMVDMRDTMMKLLPDVLLKLSKISATPLIAMPVLQFLSTLSQLPTVYSNFVSDQYMAVFAIALPYTNPFKYDNYVVCMAYHVIAVWFLKCRLPFRREFVKFIVNGLHTNVMSPFTELNQFKMSLSALNQDSSDRKRSSSLTEQSSRRRQQPSTDSSGKSGGGATGNFMQKNVRDQTVLTFYEELNETCIDLMARYTFSPCSALPRRLPTAEFLLSGGFGKSWMVGNKLITVTTSGCTQKVLKNGVCDKCWTVCGSQTQDENGAAFIRSNSNGGGDESNAAAATTSRRSSGDSSGGLVKNLVEERREPPICACWCQGWAEIYIRRPTGNVSWVMKVQNKVSFKQTTFDFPLNEMATIFMPGLHSSDSKKSSLSLEDSNEQQTSATRPISVPGSPTTRRPLSRQSSKDSEDEEFEYDDGTNNKSRNPVRRSNSSPEMANWKNPFVHQKSEIVQDVGDDDQIKKKKERVSCEAIPEEIAGMGTSPPTDVILQSHPKILSCHSYPGSSPPSEIPPKVCQTVPHSPNSICAKPPNFDDKNLERPNNLPNLTNLTPLSSKPPQSPTQTSPRLPRHLIDKDVLGIQKSSSSSKLEKSKAKSLQSDGLDNKRERLNTISGMPSSRVKPQHKKQIPKETLKSGLNPSFVFLQLYHTAQFGNANEVPLVVHSTDQINRAINILDRMYPYEVHKIGVVYVGEGQANQEAEILKNTVGSFRYMEFLQNLGTLIRLADVEPQNTFLGGLDHKGSNGKYMYTHQDDLVMLAFHVATLMPNKEGDPYCTSKKSHICNDNVIIIYNDSGEKINIATFKTQVTVAFIIIEPLDYNCNRVEVKARSEEFRINSANEEMIVSDQSVSILVRQLAIHADLAATVLNSLRSHSTDPYASNWLERLRKLKMLRTKVIEEIKRRRDEQKGHSDSSDSVQDFTDFT